MQGTIVQSDPITTGEYRLFVSNVEDVEGLFGPQVKFTLEVMDEGEYQHRQLMAWAPAKLSTKCKLASWAKACGHPFRAGENFDSDNLVGSEVIGVVLRKKKDDGTEFNHVDELKSTDPFEGNGN